YPYLIPILKKMLPENVTIIDSGQAVARQTKLVLEKFDLLSNASELGSHQFFSNKNEKVLSNILPLSKLNLTVSFKDF
ncbi:MAG: glutamate racemase, partial [Maribacter arcticus]